MIIPLVIGQVKIRTYFEKFERQRR